MLDSFVSLLTDHFDNSAQHAANPAMPLCRHINTVLNGKIQDLPTDFDGVFVLEESYYPNPAPHLFLFTQKGDTVVLTSYEMPEGFTKETFTYDKVGTVDYSTLTPSAKFTPAVYTQKDGAWEGGSVSMFSPVLKFTLKERFTPDVLEVTESMEVNGKETFGFPEPILYKRS